MHGNTELLALPSKQVLNIFTDSSNPADSHQKLRLFIEFLFSDIIFSYFIVLSSLYCFASPV